MSDSNYYCCVRVSRYNLLDKRNQAERYKGGKKLLKKKKNVKVKWHLYNLYNIVAADARWWSFRMSSSFLWPLSPSDGSYPKDEGSSQEVTQSLFVGESRNRGTNGGQNKYWGLGGRDGKMRTLPRNRWGGAHREKKPCFVCEMHGMVWEELAEKSCWEKQTRTSEPERRLSRWTHETAT